MSVKLNIKKGDTVKVISGESKGKQGRVLRIDAATGRAVVEGANLIKKHSKPNAQNPQGGIVEQEAPIHMSNLMIVDAKGNTTRIGKKIDEKTGKSVRFSKKSGEVIK
ncbi:MULTISPECIES: 50S ribosomal protein L24 [unclassified Lentimicrobium]|uniref:50S ribosomal protein L24 n=1 Tax=unclassified Lentimicrobium TaxID=2677434 RepID=UPI001557C299|nr:MULTISPECIES: 50S ribosomal protein L24 [unclassified Lentimicrobium]NPD44355.1 50S ribosomal protein L24 [Lentimicrobium sp. S6]NPD86149.1 50S ribosomal protein L24 [Lentimicrobium sp. L6]